MDLCDDVMSLIMHMCDIHTQMVCQQWAVLNTDERGQNDAIQRLIDEEDTITLRWLCKQASNDNRLCRLLSILMCYSIDADKFNSFRCILLHLPPCKYPMVYEFGINTVGVWALMHSAARFRPQYMQMLMQKFSYNSFEMQTANNIALHHNQGWVRDILETARSRCHYE